MSWKNILENTELVIITGDGKVYGRDIDIYDNEQVNTGEQILYKSTKRSIGLNTVALEYNDMNGAEVKRPKLSYKIYSIVVYFQGENHLERTNEFLESISDTRLWTVKHPFYGEIKCQPAEYSQDNTSQNITAISLELWESLINEDGTFNKDSTEAFKELSEKTLENIVIDSSKLKPSQKEVAKLTGFTKVISNVSKSKVKIDSDLSSINKSISKCNSYLGSFGTETRRYMEEMANILTAPARFYDTINNRLNYITESYTTLKSSLGSTPSLFNKILFEQTAGLTILSLSEASITTKKQIADGLNIVDNSDELSNKTEIQKIIEMLLNMYNDYLAMLDSFNTEKVNTSKSYTPSFNIITGLEKSINKACGNLYKIALTSKVEKIFVLDKDYKLIELVNYLYNDISEDLINRFIMINDIKMNEFVIIKKGRTVKYYD